MGHSDDIEDSTYSRHQDLCQKLNMDATAAAEAWRSYETIRQNYTLEVSIYPRVSSPFSTSVDKFCSLAKRFVVTSHRCSRGRPGARRTKIGCVDLETNRGHSKARSASSLFLRRSLGRADARSRSKSLERHLSSSSRHFSLGRFPSFYFALRYNGPIHLTFYSI